jgi:hypothetical protein
MKQVQVMKFFWCFKLSKRHGSANMMLLNQLSPWICMTAILLSLGMILDVTSRILAVWGWDRDCIKSRQMGVASNVPMVIFKAESFVLDEGQNSPIC